MDFKSAHVDTQRNVAVTAVSLKLLREKLERDERDVRVVHGLQRLPVSTNESVIIRLTMPSSEQSMLPSVTSSLIAVNESVYMWDGDGKRRVATCLYSMVVEERKGEGKLQWQERERESETYHQGAS